MWTIDNIGNVIIRLGLFVIFPCVAYFLYSSAEINVAIWFIISALGATVLTAFLSPFLMIALAILEGGVRFIMSSQKN